MTVRELIKQLQSIKNQELQVVYGHTEYDSGDPSTYLWGIDNPKDDNLNGRKGKEVIGPSHFYKIINKGARIFFLFCSENITPKKANGSIKRKW